MAALLLAALAFLGWQLLPLAYAPAPATWALAAAGAWAGYLLLRPRAQPLGGSDQLLVLWGFASALGLLSFLKSDPTFQVSTGLGFSGFPVKRAVQMAAVCTVQCTASCRRRAHCASSGASMASPNRAPLTASRRRPAPPQGWGDVYFFCGRDLQHCNCDFQWNARGWRKAAVLWNFVLSAALGAQRLLVQVGLDGFLPGGWWPL